MTARPLPTDLKQLPPYLEACEGFAPVVAALKDGHAATVDGAWHSAAPLTVAALARHSPATILVVIPHPRDLDAWAEDLASYTGLAPLVFPAWDNLPTKETVLDEVGGARLRIIRRLDGDTPPRIVLTTLTALIQPVPTREQLAERRKKLRVPMSIAPEELVKWLVARDFTRMNAVETPGEFSQRGGIIDVFSSDAEAPYRIEFFGDDIESIRQFSPETQRSLGDLKAIEITAPGLPVQGADGMRGHLCHYLPSGAWTAMVEMHDLQEQGKFYLERVADVTGLFSVPGTFKQLTNFPNVHISSMPMTSVEAICHLRVESVERFSGDVTKVRDELDTAAKHDHVVIACHNDAERKRLGEVLGSSELAKNGRLALVLGHVQSGYRLVAEVDGSPDSAKSSLAAPLSPRGEGPGVRGPSSRSRDDGAVGDPNTKSSQLADDGMEGFSSVPPSEQGTLAPSPPAPLPEGRGVHVADRIERSGLLRGLVVVGDHELFRRESMPAILPRRRLESRAIDSFLELQEDDLVVHLSHGIARFKGMHLLEKNGNTEEHLVLEFAGGTLVYVPVSKIELVQKYVGGSKAEPELSKLGGSSWAKKKERAEAAVLDLASEMVELQALREAQPGLPYPGDTDWQREFEAAFPYEETPDQLTSLAEIKGDMQKSRPMDRLLCGDVGYGKTELALRAAFKAVDNGKQVAILVPTTVLAEQHFRTFSSRLAEYPFVVETVSRFRTHGEQRAIIKRLGEGQVDIIVGTHRLVSNDVKIPELGLVIIDEEQRFGVEHKEKLKKLRQMVDVLTMTATPIPRTLHLSLLGIRDISNLETPPMGRLPIETRIVRWDKTLIRHAILRELNREGQVYFVHNRVYNIQEIADRLNEIVPEAKIVIGHGQMTPDELEHAMVAFVQKKADILVATTIIESGLDIPNANTIFINQADNYGLADLHQLRGRVGRYKHRAYAYMVLDGEKAMTPNASRRLKAIEEFTELGAGFKIAMRDLEIRGAGNILGTQQSGHIAAVGYELYCQLLENAVRSMKNMPVKTHLEVNLDLPWEAYLPRDYVPGQKLRIEVYRRLSRVRDHASLADFRKELIDRYGKIPEVSEWMMKLADLRLLATAWQIGSIHLEGKGLEGGEGPVDIVIGYRHPRKIETLAKRSNGRVIVVDKESAYLRTKANERTPGAMYRLLQHVLRLPDENV